MTFPQSLPVSANRRRCRSRAASTRALTTDDVSPNRSPLTFRSSLLAPPSSLLAFHSSLFFLPPSFLPKRWRVSSWINLTETVFVDSSKNLTESDTLTHE